MSNYLAIATVTATLQSILQEALSEDNLGGTIAVGRPDGAAADGALGVKLFLYQITPNAAGRNADLPTRRTDGSLMQRPRAALNLHYLLSFTGSDSDLGPQRLLGSVVRKLNAEPVLSREKVQKVIQNIAALGGSDLPNDIDMVRCTPLGLSLEELSKLWSIFFQIPYSLSIAYQASVVFVEGSETPQAALPVQLRNVYAIPIRQPYVEQIVSAAGIGQPITDSGAIVIKGNQLQGQTTQIIINDAVLTPTTTSPTQIALTLPGGLVAGVQSLQVLQGILIGTLPNQHSSSVASNLAPFVLVPKIAIQNVTTNSVKVGFTPNVGKSQRATLLLNELNAPDKRAAYQFNFAAPKNNGISDPTQTDTPTITFAIRGVPAGDYLVRVQVDGAQSAPDVDTNSASPTFGQYLGTPKVSIP